MPSPYKCTVSGSKWATCVINNEKTFNNLYITRKRFMRTKQIYYVDILRYNFQTSKQIIKQTNFVSSSQLLLLKLDSNG